jgi:glycosyltransferase involved in cell wall biosynthesis
MMSDGATARAGTGRLPMVLHVTQPTDGGVARCVSALVTAQVAAGWPVAVACPATGWLTESAVAAGADVHLWPARRSPGPSVAVEARRLEAVFSAVVPALVHLHSSKAGLVGRTVLRGRRPTVFQPHAWSFEAVSGGLRQLTTAWERRAGRWTDVTICVSEAERQQGIRAGIAANYAVVQNGIDLTAHPTADRWQRARARERLGIGPGPLAVCVGRLCRQKGQTLLVEAWRLVAAALPDARLALIGDGPDFAALHHRAGREVRLTGAVTDPGDWYAAADLVVCPSRWEGMALVPLEAMARGRSVVASDVTGMREAIPPGAGALTPPGDVLALAAAITVRLRQPAIADAEGRTGRQHVVGHHSVVGTARAIDRLYRDILALPARTADPVEAAAVSH